MELEQIQQSYDRSANGYKFFSRIGDWLILSRFRQRIFGATSGKILEVAVGNGQNLAVYPRGSAVTGLDISPAMLELARQRARQLSLSVELKVGDVENLPFANGSFDTVVSSLAVCTFPDPVKALQEMRRVCRSGSQVLLLEHGRSNLRWVARRQDHKARRYGPNRRGCFPNRNPLELAKKAGLTIAKVERPLWGYLYIIWARP